MKKMHQQALALVALSAVFFSATPIWKTVASIISLNKKMFVLHVES